MYFKQTVKSIFYSAWHYGNIGKVVTLNFFQMDFFFISIAKTNVNTSESENVL